VQQARRVTAATGDEWLVEALRCGDDEAFRTLIDARSPSLLRVARAHVGSRAVAEEVVQETWLGVLRGLERFEGRSSLETWIFRILTNVAATRGARERRCVPFSSITDRESERLLLGDHDRRPHRCAVGPPASPTPEDELLSAETRELVLEAIDDLPPAQRSVIGLRDVEGWPSEEVCSALAISQGNQRVLLHRARTRVPNALDGYLGAAEPTTA
jgi:RNA polymerase sigma-70 factor, ECF subfamily